MSRVAVRRAGPGDAERLALIAGATFLESYAELIPGDDLLTHVRERNSTDWYARHLADPAHALWLAETVATRVPVGFAMLSPPDLPMATGPADAELKRIYLLSRFQGGGGGRSLLQAAADEAQARGKRRLLVGVHSGNERAIGFYRAMGFADAGVRRFQVGESWFDDLVLALTL